MGKSTTPEKSLLQGDDYTCPVGPDTAHPVLSPGKVVRNLLHAEALPPEAWGSYRGVYLPSTTVTVGQMVDTVRDVAGEAVAARVRYQPDPFIEEIVGGWPTTFAPGRALEMGFKKDSGVREIVEAFIEDDLDGTVAI